MTRTPVGEVRPSQLLWTYGPGSLIDLPNISVVTMGIDRWELGRCQPIQEARLLTHVRRVLGDQVESLRMPPLTEQDVVDPFSAEAFVGVPVSPAYDDLPPHPAPAEKIALLRALADRTESLMPLAAARGVPVPEGIAPAARRYFDFVEAIIESGVGVGAGGEV